MKVSGWGGNIWDKALSIFLVMAIAGALGMLSYSIIAAQELERFTEFYILDSRRIAFDYLSVVKVGARAEVIVGIHNHENYVKNYRLEIKVDGIVNNSIGSIVLANEEKWEEAVSFIPGDVGDNKKVEFVLFTNEESEPHLEPLYLWVSVTE